MATQDEFDKSLKPNYQNQFVSGAPPSPAMPPTPPASKLTDGADFTKPPAPMPGVAPAPAPTAPPPIAAATPSPLRTPSNTPVTPGTSRQDLINQIPNTDKQAPASDGSMNNPLNNEFGRNLVNTVNALPGIASIPGVAARAVGLTSPAISPVGRAAQAVAPYAPVIGGGAALASASSPAAPPPPAPAAAGAASPAGPGYTYHNPVFMGSPDLSALPSGPGGQGENKLVNWDRTGLSNADVAKANPNGRVTMQRQADGTMSFSGGNVSGPVSYVDTKGNAAPGAGIRGNGFGQVLTAPAGNLLATDGKDSFVFSNELVKGMSSPSGQSANTTAAAGQARAAAAGSPAPQAGWSGVIGGSTFGFDPAARNAELERNKLVASIMDDRTKRSQRQALTNLAQIASNDTNSFARLASEEARAAAGNQTALETTGMREQGEDFRASARNAIAAGELGVRASEATGAKQLRDVQLQAAQRAQGITARYDAAKTDAERQSIMQMYPDVFGQKQAQPQGKDRYMVVGGGTSVVDGQTVREPAQIFDTVTQQVLGGQQQAQAAKPQYQKDGVYQDANGNKQKWDGAKFVPV